MSKSNDWLFGEVDEAVVSDGSLGRHKGCIKDQPIFFIVMYNQPLGSEHEVRDERCKPSCREGEYLFLAVFLVHHNHDLWQSHINGFVVAIFIQFLELVSGAQGIEGGRQAIHEDAS